MTPEDRELRRRGRMSLLADELSSLPADYAPTDLELALAKQLAKELRRFTAKRK